MELSSDLRFLAFGGSERDEKLREILEADRACPRKVHDATLGHEPMRIRKDNSDLAGIGVGHRITVLRPGKGFVGIHCHAPFHANYREIADDCELAISREGGTLGSKAHTGVFCRYLTASAYFEGNEWIARIAGFATSPLTQAKAICD